MGFSKLIIVSRCGGFIDLVRRESGEQCGWLINGQTTPCFGMLETVDNLYTGIETWFDPNLIELSANMHLAYEMWKENPQEGLKTHGINAKKRAQEFSYENVGNIIRKLLDD